MANQSYTNDVVVTADNVNAVNLNSGEFVYLAQGTTISALGTFGVGINGPQSITTKISGDVFGRYHGIATTTGGGSHITINSTGSVSGGYNDAISLAGSGNKIVNYGDINGEDGIDLISGGNDIKNYGHINGDDVGVYLSGSASDKNTVLNKGSIDGGSSAMECGAAADTIINTGTIAGDVNLSDGNDVFDNRLGTLFGGVFGGAGNDIIRGGSFDDLIVGGLGIDKLTGGGGEDTFRFAEGGSKHKDTIVDFRHLSDKIELDNSYFTTLKDGALSSSQFRIGSAAADSNDHLIYNKAGELLYDVDGSGAKAAIVIATLSGDPTLTAADILVV